MKIIKWITFSFIIIISIPVLVFAEGSITGEHSIKYSREGTWLCWIPHDHMHSECMLIVEFVPVSKLNDIAPNARGFVRCKDSEIEIGNIDFDGHIGLANFASLACPHS